MNSLKKEFPILIKLALPLVIAGLVQSSVYFFETFYLAHVSKETLAASALVGWLFATMTAVLFGTLSSINVNVSHAFGAKDDASIATTIRDGFWLAALFSIPGVIIAWNIPPVFLWLGQTEGVVKLAQAYLHALAWGLLPNFILIAFLETVVGLGLSRVSMVFCMMIAGMMVVFSGVLIFGKCGFPALGIAGAGWGITVANLIAMLLILVYLLMHKEVGRRFNKLFNFSGPSHIWELIKIGFPTGLMISVEVGFFLTLTLLMGRISSQMLAANQIAMQYLGLLMSFVFAISQAVTVRMGHLLGAKETQAAKSVAYAGVTLSVLFMFVIALVFWIYPDPLIAFDFNLHAPENQEIIHDIKNLLIVSAIFQLFEAARLTLFGVLRALKDTRFTLIVSIISFWFVALPLGCFLALTLQWGGTGLWWGMVAGAFISLCMLYSRFQVKMG